MNTENERANEATKPLGTIEKVSIAPDKKQRGKRAGSPKAAIKTPTQRGRRSGTTVTTTKRPYTRRIPVAATSTSPISALLRANGFTAAATIEVHEGRKRLSIPLGLLGS